MGKLEELRIKNNNLNKENSILKQTIEDLKNNDDILNEKMSELEELRKQKDQQSQIIINQKQQIQKLQQQQKQQQQKTNTKTTATPEIVNKYNTLRKTYDQLNRDHEDILVFVGHLHDQ